jgi:hypothetical protein
MHRLTASEAAEIIAEESSGEVPLKKEVITEKIIMPAQMYPIIKRSFKIVKNLQKT